MTATLISVRIFWDNLDGAAGTPGWAWVARWQDSDGQIEVESGPLAGGVAAASSALVAALPESLRDFADIEVG